jgi:hypothetical protein
LGPLGRQGFWNRVRGWNVRHATATHDRGRCPEVSKFVCSILVWQIFLIWVKCRVRKFKGGYVRTCSMVLLRRRCEYASITTNILREPWSWRAKRLSLGFGYRRRACCWWRVACASLWRRWVIVFSCTELFICIGGGERKGGCAATLRGGSGMSIGRDMRTAVCLLEGSSDGFDFLLAGLNNHSR